MGHKRLRVLGVVAAALMLAVACGSSSGGGTAKQIKVGLVTDTGGLNDKSFNHLAYVGLQSAISKLGIKGDGIESRSGDDCLPNLANLASKGEHLVVGHGFLIPPALRPGAAPFPNIKLANVDGA